MNFLLCFFPFDISIFVFHSDKKTDSRGRVIDTDVTLPPFCSDYQFLQMGDLEFLVGAWVGREKRGWWAEYVVDAMML